ncbi:hypothetical protein [Spirosoma sp.]|uniref:hypothetical protein n=1 Tax=Spirosoma sp. TaxID=1899569 RepID=UPI003B3AA1F9
MKSMLFYLALVALLVVGTKLVNRQRRYTRLVQSSAPTYVIFHNRIHPRTDYNSTHSPPHVTVSSITGKNNVSLR